MNKDKNNGFEIADDFDRATAPRATREKGPLAIAVIEGHTVFVAGLPIDKASARLRSATEGGKYRIRGRTSERNGVKGVYVWRELKDVAKTK